MARKLCPQKFDCLKMGAEKGRKCPNSDFCLEVRKLGGNKKLPYEVERCNSSYSGLPLTCNLLRVKYEYDPEWRKYLKEFGWAYPEQIPYSLFLYEEEKLPILMVFSYENDGKTGWQSAEDLPSEYFRWCAAKLSNNWHEYQSKLEEIRENQRWDYHKIWWD